MWHTEDLLFCVLGETNVHIARMTEELSEKSEELVRYQEEISSLLSQIVDLQHKLKEVCTYSVDRGNRIDVTALRGCLFQMILHSLEVKEKICEHPWVFSFFFSLLLSACN